MRCEEKSRPSSLYIYICTYYGREKKSMYKKVWAYSSDRVSTRRILWMSPWRRSRFPRGHVSSGWKWTKYISEHRPADSEKKGRELNRRPDLLHLLKQCSSLHRADGGSGCRAMYVFPISDSSFFFFLAKLELVLIFIYSFSFHETTLFLFSPTCAYKYIHAFM